jgi:hypothetical protein
LSTTPAHYSPPNAATPTSPLHDELTAARIRPLAPVVVLAQAWRGGPQHQISRVLKGCDPGGLSRIAHAIGVKIRLFPV